MNKYYFAYGSNLNLKVFEEWCGSRNLPRDRNAPAPLKALCRAYLPDMKLVFSRYSFWRGGGVLDIQQEIGCHVPGMIFGVDDSGRKLLDRKEGAPNIYHRVDAAAVAEDGRDMPVTTYEVVRGLREEFREPSAAYVEVVRQGLKDFGLDVSPLLAAAKNCPRPGAVDCLFVYGTLMQGECRHGLIPREQIESVDPAVSRGQLLELEGYPGLILPDSDGRVQGELIRLRSSAEVLKKLDRVEGFYGFGNSDSLFRRVLVKVEVGGGRAMRAWAYVLNQTPERAKVITSGSWREHHG